MFEDPTVNIYYLSSLKKIRQIIGKFVFSAEKTVIVYNKDDRKQLMEAIIGLMKHEGVNYSKIGMEMINNINDFNKSHRC